MVIFHLLGIFFDTHRFMISVKLHEILKVKKLQKASIFGYWRLFGIFTSHVGRTQCFYVLENQGRRTISSLYGTDCDEMTMKIFTFVFCREMWTLIWSATTRQPCFTEMPPNTKFYKRIFQANWWSKFLILKYLWRCMGKIIQLSLGWRWYESN